VRALTCGRARLEETRRLQQDRLAGRGKASDCPALSASAAHAPQGVETARLAGLSVDTLGAGGAARQAQEGEAPEEHGLKLRDTFYAEAQQEAGQEDPAMLKFIEAELAKRRGAAGGGGGAAAPLRDAPEEPRAGKRRDEDGADRWLAGIEEVQLPVEYKLKARPPSSAAGAYSHAFSSCCRTSRIRSAPRWRCCSERGLVQPRRRPRWSSEGTMRALPLSWMTLLLPESALRPPTT